MLTFYLPVAIFSVLALIAGTILGFATHFFQIKTDLVADYVDALLPQSQCTQCGYPGCRSYAEAIADGSPINKCIPGGEAVMLKIAAQLNLDQQLMEGEVFSKPKLSVAYIDESNCIGCTKCIQACPVDAIIGTKSTVHTVVSILCTGCNLCLVSCPINCIEIRSFPTSVFT